MKWPGGKKNLLDRMRIIGVVCAFLLVTASCDINELDVSDPQVPNVRSIIALPIGEMIYSMTELIGEITTEETDTLIDEFGRISLIYGDTAQFDYPTDGSIAVDRSDTFLVADQIMYLEFFESFGSAGITFESPELNFTFTNSLATPMAISFENFYAERTDATTGEIVQVQLSGEITEEPQVIASPDPSQVGSSVQSTISINAGNSNIRELFAIGPSRIGFVLYGITNYPEIDPDAVLNGGASLTTEMEIVLPMVVQLSDFTLPLDFVIGDDIQFDDADSVQFRMVTSNFLPFSTELDLLIMDGQDTLYSVLENLVMVPPFLDRNLEAVEPKVNIANIPIGADGIDAINNATGLRMVMRLNTPSTLTSQDIFAPILDRYTLEIKLSILGRVDLEL